MNASRRDPVIDEIRELRHRISERFGHDPAKLVAHYIAFQQKFHNRLLQTETSAKTGEQTEPAGREALPLS
jgi:hypothetical protein